MFLRHLGLRNIRSIDSLDIQFDAGGDGRAWTYILGENGTGKSSVLRAIALVMAGGDAVTELVNAPDEWIQLGQDSASIKIEFATADGEQRQAALEFRRGMTSFSFVTANHDALRELDAAIAKSDRNYFVVGYGVTRRSRGDEFSSVSVSSPYRSSRAQAVGSLFSPDASLVSLERWAMDLDYRRGPQGLEVVREAFKQLLPEVDFHSIDRENRRLLFSTPDGVLPLSALSDGYQAMAAWCGDLLYRLTETFQDRRRPLDARGLLLVDELDLHLHPKWQRRLVAFLKQTLPNLQAVVTTHSPLTIHQAGEGELFVLIRHAESVRIEPFVGAPNKMLLTQLLESPAFGLLTQESPQTVEARDELRWLESARGEKDPQDRRKIRELKRELAGVPKWREVPPYLKRTNALLNTIARHLEPNVDDPLGVVAAGDATATRDRQDP